VTGAALGGATPHTKARISRSSKFQYLCACGELALGFAGISAQSADNFPFVVPMTLQIQRDLAARAARLEQSGDRAEADRAYSALFSSAAQAGRVADLVDALRGHARIRNSLCEYEEADEMARLSWTIASLHGLTAAAARAANICGIIRHAQGDLEAAREIYEQVVELAREAGDDETLGIGCQNLGVVLNARGDLRDARALYLEAICSWVRSPRPHVAANIYNNLGMVCADLEEWMESEIHFLRGIEIAERVGQPQQLAQLCTGRAEPLIRMGEFQAARKSLNRAEALAVELDDSRILVDVYRFRAMIARLEGEYGRAEEWLNRALAIAESRKIEQEHGEALEEMARLRWAMERRGAARVVLREARRIYESLGAEQDVTRLDSTAHEWLSLASGPALH
jgi:tetratricopeptide (TPR) repeat protein